MRLLPVIDRLEPRFLLAHPESKTLPVEMRPPSSMVFHAPTTPAAAEEFFSDLEEIAGNGELPLVIAEREAIRAEQLREFLGRPSETNDVEGPTDEASLREIPECMPEDLPEVMRPKEESPRQFIGEELAPFVCGTDERVPMP